MNSTELENNDIVDIAESDETETVTIQTVIHVIPPLGLSNDEIQKYVFPKVVDEYNETNPKPADCDDVFHVWFTPKEIERIEAVIEKSGLTQNEYLTRLYKDMFKSRKFAELLI